MNKEKIEEIYMDTLKLTDDEWVAKYGEGNGYHEAFETLIQEEREEAVRGLVDYLKANTKRIFYLGCARMINEYLGTVESDK